MIELIDRALARDGRVGDFAAAATREREFFGERAAGEIAIVFATNRSAGGPAARRIRPN